MSDPQNNNPDPQAVETESSELEKTCFVIMPISDMDGYDAGHFKRVYEHIIKPSCIKAGFNPIRADDVKQTNEIVLDILRKLMDCDMAICDLSGKNPNVLYELGIRQAFDKPISLIKDDKTSRIFDIQGLRTVVYDSTLRVDEVKKMVNELSESINATYKAREKNVNSLVKLLSVMPATVPSRTELSKETSIIISALRDIGQRVTAIEDKISDQRSYSMPSRSSNEQQCVIDAPGREITILNPVSKQPLELVIGETYQANGHVVGVLKNADTRKQMLEFKTDKGPLIVPFDHPFLDKLSYELF